MELGPAGRRWADQLAAWAIPPEILAAAPESPWQFPPAIFTAPEVVVSEPNLRRLARQALPEGGTVLDVGVGGGSASLPLAPPAALIVGFDQSAELLEAFAAAAEGAGVGHREVRGTWPADSGAAPVADVVTCAHVLYNVADPAPFAQVLTAHARQRVVLDLGAVHPRRALNRVWAHFHPTQPRPDGPTADDAIAALAEAGIEVAVERAPQSVHRQVRRDHRVASVRRYLCLTADRDPEIDEVLGEYPEEPISEVVTLWWPGGAGRAAAARAGE